jgi:hypothetical protein
MMTRFATRSDVAGEEYSRHLSELSRRGKQGGYRWQRAEEQALAIESLSIEDVRNFFEQELGVSRRAGLSVRVSGPKAVTVEPGESTPSKAISSDEASVQQEKDFGVTADEASAPTLVDGLGADGACSCGDASCAAEGAASFKPVLDLGQMSKLRRGSAPLPPAPVDSHPVVAEAIAVKEVDISGLSFREFKASRPLFPEMV